MVKGAEVNFCTTLYHHNKEKSNNLLPHPLIYLIWLRNLTLVNFDTFYRNYEKRNCAMFTKMSKYRTWSQKEPQSLIWVCRWWRRVYVVLSSSPRFDSGQNFTWDGGGCSCWWCHWRNRICSWIHRYKIIIFNGMYAVITLQVSP